MWTWIRKHIFRIVKEGRHRAESGPSTLEQSHKTTLRSGYPVTYSGSAIRPEAIRSPLVHVPVVSETTRAKAISTGCPLSSRENFVPVVPGNSPEVPDYVPRHMDAEETRITSEDWTSPTESW